MENSARRRNVASTAAAALCGFPPAVSAELLHSSTATEGAQHDTTAQSHDKSKSSDATPKKTDKQQNGASTAVAALRGLTVVSTKLLLPFKKTRTNQTDSTEKPHTRSHSLDSALEKTAKPQRVVPSSAVTALCGFQPMVNAQLLMPAQPINETPKPIEETPKPVDETPKPIEEMPKPVDEKPKLIDEKIKLIDEKMKLIDEKLKLTDEKLKLIDETPKPIDQTPKPIDETYQFEEPAYELSELYQISEESEELSEDSDESSEDSDEGSEDSDETEMTAAERDLAECYQLRATTLNILSHPVTTQALREKAEIDLRDLEELIEGFEEDIRAQG